MAQAPAKFFRDLTFVLDCIIDAQLTMLPTSSHPERNSAEDLLALAT